MNVKVIVLCKIKLYSHPSKYFKKYNKSTFFACHQIEVYICLMSWAPNWNSRNSTRGRSMVTFNQSSERLSRSSRVHQEPFCISSYFHFLLNYSDQSLQGEKNRCRGGRAATKPFSWGTEVVSFTCCCCYSPCRIKFEILLSPFFIVCYRLEIETTKRDVTMSIQTCVFIVTIYVSVSYVSSEQGSKSLDLKYLNHSYTFCLFV